MWCQIQIGVCDGRLTSWRPAILAPLTALILSACVMGGSAQSDAAIRFPALYERAVASDRTAALELAEEYLALADQSIHCPHARYWLRVAARPVSNRNGVSPGEGSTSMINSPVRRQALDRLNANTCEVINADRC